MTISSYLAICLSLLLSSNSFPLTDPLTLTANDDAVVYETFFKGGKIEYTERDTGSSQDFKYVTTQAPIQNPPLQNYWETERRGGTRSFSATSPSPAYERPTVASVADSAVVAFRSAADGSLSAVTIALRNPQTNAGNSGSTSTPVTVHIPPQSIAYAAIVFRRSTAPIQIDFNSKSFQGSDSVGFFEIARNETANPLDVVVSGLTKINQSTTFQLTLSQADVGPNVTFLMGRFGSEPMAIAAAVITKRL